MLWNPNSFGRLSNQWFLRKKNDWLDTFSAVTKHLSLITWISLSSSFEIGLEMSRSLKNSIVVVVNFGTRLPLYSSLLCNFLLMSIKNVQMGVSKNIEFIQLWFVKNITLELTVLYRIIWQITYLSLYLKISLNNQNTSWFVYWTKYFSL